MANETPKKNNRRWIPVIIVLILAGLCIGVWYYFAKSPDKEKHIENLAPHVNMSKITITDIDGETIKFKANVVLANAFPVKLNTRRIQYQVYIDTAMIARSSYNEALTINSNDSISMDLPMEASVKRTLNILEEFKKQQIDSADYRVKAQVYINVPISGERQFDFDLKKRLPAFLLPELKLADTDIKKLGLKESGIDLQFVVNNPNNFELKLKDSHLSVNIDHNIDLEGTLEDLILPAKGNQTVSVHLNIKTNKLGKAAWKLLFDKRHTHFYVVFKGKANADNQILNNTNLLVTAQGTVEEMLQAVKEIRK